MRGHRLNADHYPDRADVGILRGAAKPSMRSPGPRLNVSRAAGAWAATRSDRIGSGSAVFWLGMQSWLVLEALEVPPSREDPGACRCREPDSACSLASCSSSHPTSSRGSVAFDRA
jgi:hypothetical protein